MRLFPESPHAGDVRNHHSAFPQRVERIWHSLSTEPGDSVKKRSPALWPGFGTNTAPVDYGAILILSVVASHPSFSNADVRHTRYSPHFRRRSLPDRRPD
jgi:hypothetical protein